MKNLAGIDFDSVGRVINMIDPASPQDAATKAYVDSNLYKPKLILGSVGVANSNGAPSETWMKLTADAVVSTTTLTTIMTTQALAIGLWLFEYHLIYYTAASTTGAAFAVNFDSGASNEFFAHRMMFGTGTTATSGISATSTTGSASALIEHFTASLPNNAMGPSLGNNGGLVPTYEIIKGMVNLTVASSVLELKLASKVAASAVTVRDRSSLILKRVS